MKDIYDIDDSFAIEDEKYDTWLKVLLNKTDEEITEKDVYTMLKQHELEDLGIKKAIEFVQLDPLAGEMWDGQFLEQLSKAPAEKLVNYKDELKTLLSYIDSQINDFLWDFEFEKEEFMTRYLEFENCVSSL
ncbi:contact-dependent growth inhibition system immunity protein [Listeria seeligeri]|uniref:contact-dependent growth inhibition system immunity protein n=1 Tax=Listeria seeligeri TaxID=1640 RepID=UPI0030DA2049|nr:hypothetical protein [Listeria seeligeri]MBM5611149.1 hypothetical protein [Listeria seeligeri]